MPNISSSGSYISSVRCLIVATILFSALAGAEATAQPTEPPATITISRASGPIALDGRLDEAAWQNATRVETWYETNPGDSIPSPLRNVGRLTYDDKYFYAGFDFDDPNMRKLRAPFGDRDNVPSTTDYAGVILNPSNDRKTAILFLANPRGIQYDALTNDATGEDSSPDYYWEARTSIRPDGWTLEMRIPFSSLRYSDAKSQTWGILLYRNYPRDRRYQMFSAKLPRGGNCFICNSNALTGMEDLPSSGHLTVAPYVTVKQNSFTRDGLGTPLESEDVEFDGGLDVKFTPSADTAVDLTLNPDFSQVESDVAVVSANERFAIFFPEKRPFFLEGIDLFSTPIQAVYTRSITSPGWGARSTGKLGETAYTVLVTDDRGGGTVIIPGANSSVFADQDFDSYNLIGRMRRDIGRSFVSLLVAAREIDGGGSNRVAGPDFEWRPTEKDQITGQFLFSQTETPQRPELAAEWNGQKLESHAAQTWWFHSTRKVDWFFQYDDRGDDFRADLGFVPQVGFRRGYGEGGYTFRPKGFLNRLRTFLITDYSADRDGSLIFRQVSPGVGMDGRWSSFMRFRYAMDKVRSGNETFDRNQLLYQIDVSPNLVFNQISLSGWIGEEVDFSNSRLGEGARVTLNATVRPTDHLELRFNNDYRYLDVTERKDRLFTAQVERLKATYTFSAKSFLRLIGQHVKTERDPSLYEFVVGENSGSFSMSGLFAYKLNWQTVLFLGFGDNRAFEEDGDLEEEDRQLFLKVSYAFQR